MARTKNTADEVIQSMYDVELFIWRRGTSSLISLGISLALSAFIVTKAFYP